MSGSSRLPAARRPNMRPPTSRATHSRQAMVSGIASSPVIPTSSFRERTTRHGSASPIASRPKRKAPQELREDDNATNIQVVVRCRGRSEREKADNSAVIVSMPGGINGAEVALTDPLSIKDNKLYTFDGAFGPEADQSRMYDKVVEPILKQMLDGYNCTIFAYGQTGTGKTYTMTGDMTDRFGSFADNAGIIPRALYNLFKQLGPDMDDKSVKCSFIELYNEELRDLLALETSPQLKIFDDTKTKGGVFVQGIEESFIKTAQDGLTLLREGSLKRQVGATKCNEHSSRSHTVFTITVHVKDTTEDGEVMVRCGKLNLVDLAGSENIGRSGAENKRAREAGMINQSLLTLGRVINALVDKSSHIPYRESKLTRLLQDSLGGRTKTCIIATISPARSNAEETVSTLDYASRAKNIKNKPQANHLLSKKTMLQEYVTEIEKLKADLKATRTKHGHFMTQDNFDEIQLTLESRRILIEENERRFEALDAQVKKKNDEYETCMRKLFDTEHDLSDSLQQLDNLNSLMRETKAQLDGMTKDWQREYALRKAHEETEEVLYSKGQELIATVGPVINDVGNLHSKVGRMADNEIQNYSIWLKNTQVINTNADRIEADLEDFGRSHHALAGKLAGRVQEFTKENMNQFRETYKYIEEKLASFQEKDAEMSEEVKVSKDEMNQVLEGMKVLRDEIKERIGESLKGLGDAAEQMAAGVVGDLGSFGQELHESYTRLTNDFDKTMEENRVYMANQKSEIEQLKVKVESTAATATKTTAEAHTQLNTILNEERAQNTLDRQSLISQITALINATADEQDGRLTQRIETVRTNLDSTRVTVEAATKEHEEHMNKLAASNESFLETLASSRERIHDSIVQDQETFSKHNDAIKATANAIHSKTVELVEAQTENIGVQMQTLDEFVARARNQNEAHYVEVEASLGFFKGLVENNLDEWTNNVKNSEIEIDHFGSEVQSDVTTLIETLEPYQEVAQQSVEALRDSVRDKVLKEYVPTGATPKKRKYEYPRTLPRTNTDEVLSNLEGGGQLALGSYQNTPRVPLSPKKGAPASGRPFTPKRRRQSSLAQAPTLGILVEH
ncbi:P-loop containing nucleoside triphosphate hydrolase protein [Geopyxis carbonaria]|nr:P-loop containing nucleoside triphosphate hydrolase protein [Geopyxis carbonaria]